ncbi:hypothetical protein [Bythopirellula polymerisocia]|uniref:Uncharacterized protein n=1 Tax=Bythopirellula polymerisocia TaxID=2528003 RepID=A0A5C6CEP9_9BACT|nr:hypothetical protein [Bythopirellula polymerisocia]TWU21901.1 hypothetical protein Pla144_43360 [Bythopirellula polymerisocia]
MSRRQIEQEDSSQDSFLDIVANLVGVIIILVMLVGAKATHDALHGIKPETLPEIVAVETGPNEEELLAQLKQARASTFQARQEVERLATRLIQIKQEAADFDAERVNLAMHRSVIEEDLARRRELLDADHQQQFDVQKRIAEYQLTLDALTKEQLGLLTGPETVEELESVPTPLAREVDGNAIHLRLKKGLVSIVPFDELLGEVQNHVDDIRRRLQASDHVVDTFGPIDGYRIRMTVSRAQDPSSLGGPRAGHIQRIIFDQYAEVLPTSEGIGQDVEQALMPGGSLYTYLQQHRRTSPSVVVWLYTDSFDDFRLLKRTLWEMGYSLATRPMLPGSNIGASPHGTKAAAQ